MGGLLINALGKSSLIILVRFCETYFSFGVDSMLVIMHGGRSSISYKSTQVLFSVLNLILSDTIQCALFEYEVYFEIAST
jgi:hypothetical protein